VGEIAFSVARLVWGGKAKNSFMNALKKNSFFAESNGDDFLQRAKDFVFVSFYEANKLGIHQVRHSIPLEC
jgi:hypothetical protein